MQTVPVLLKAQGLQHVYLTLDSVQLGIRIFPLTSLANPHPMNSNAKRMQTWKLILKLASKTVPKLDKTLELESCNRAVCETLLIRYDKKDN